jgi:BirA family biotin operon repressor/biotin-[acetyl-CoA-carboxylase] ligase
MPQNPCVSVNEDSATSCPAVWNRIHLGETASTNDVCRALPPWSAVRADSQTRGRGRFGRAFVSQKGGLWLSASLPTPGSAEIWAGFSLRVGASILTRLRALGLPAARLRWPNDILLGPRKLAGLLIEQPASGALIVGFGMNVLNEPWNDMPELKETSTRLADWLSPVPDLDFLTDEILAALADAHRQMLTGGMRAAIEELNAHWTDPQPIEITLSSGGTVRGAFIGLTPNGHLQLLDQTGSVFLVEHPTVERLRELEG